VVVVSKVIELGRVVAEQVVVVEELEKKQKVQQV
jgi:hypothetical protein